MYCIVTRRLLRHTLLSKRKEWTRKRGGGTSHCSTYPSPHTYLSIYLSAGSRPIFLSSNPDSHFPHEDHYTMQCEVESTEYMRYAHSWSDVVPSRLAVPPFCPSQNYEQGPSLHIYTHIVMNFVAYVRLPVDRVNIDFCCALPAMSSDSLMRLVGANQLASSPFLYQSISCYVPYLSRSWVYPTKPFYLKKTPPPFTIYYSNKSLQLVYFAGSVPT